MFQGQIPPTDGAPLVWALLAKRPGDNAQIRTLASATGLPVVVKPLGLRKGLETLPNLRQSGSLFSYDAETQDALTAAPPPALVIAAGKRSAPAALWLKAHRGARLLHLGRTWAPGRWFDAVVTTPQYAQPAGPNVTANLFPLTPPYLPGTALPPDLAALPRPRLLVVAGGDAVGLRFASDEARALAVRATERQARDGGSLMVATSPRTSRASAEALRDAIGPGGDRLVSLFGAGENRYHDFLAAADAVMVTEDSVSMVAEAANTGRPVELFRLASRADTGATIRRMLSATGFAEVAAELGLVDSGRKIRAYMDALGAGGWLSGDVAPARMAAELSAAVALARRLGRA